MMLITLIFNILLLYYMRKLGWPTRCVYKKVQNKSVLPGLIISRSKKHAGISNIDENQMSSYKIGAKKWCRQRSIFALHVNKKK